MNPNPHMPPARGKNTLRMVLICALIIAAVLVIGLKSGSPAMSWETLSRVLFAGGGEELHRIVVLEIRLPRVTLGLLVGALLGASGTLMQGGLNNRLAGPELLGVLPGSSLAVASVTVLHLPVPFHLHPLAALLGGLLGGFIVMLAAGGSRGASGMLLIGMSVSALLNGMLIVLIALGTSNDVQLLYTYLLGSLANRTWEHVLRIIPWALIVLPLSFVFSRSLNLLQLGDETATGLGLKAERTRLHILVVCTALAAITVAQCGPIGYIALLAPHLVRALAGTNDARTVVPLSALVGGVLLVSADLAARLLLYPLEIPVGIWTTLFGGGFLLYIYLNRRGGSGYVQS